MAVQRERVAASIAEFERLAGDRAALDPIAAPMLTIWVGRTHRTSCDYPLPTELEPALYAPSWAPLATMPFAHRCPIPRTLRLPPRDEPPPDLPLPQAPVSCWDCIEADAAAQIRDHWQRLERWHCDQSGRRPPARAWSSSAIKLPWRRAIEAGCTLDFRGGKGAWLRPNELARDAIMSREVAAQYFADYPHQRLVGMCLDGVSYQAPLPPQIVLTPNLFSMYATAGGIEAVRDEVLKHTERGFRARALPRMLPTIPFRTDPVGCAERKDDPLRPRVLCDSGSPRRALVTADTGEPVPARNDAAGPMRHHSSDLNPKWYTEVKPTLADAARNAAIIGYVACSLGAAPLTFSFDFKYFFHQLVLASHELAASGSLVPERAREAGASDTLVAIVTSVMAMGIAPASNVAQDLANALMWRLLSFTDAALRPFVSARLRDTPPFARLWTQRRRLAHDAYGTQARLVDGVQYTDDALLQSACAAAGVELLAQFAHIVGPTHRWADCPFDARHLAVSVAQGVARASNAASVPRLHGLNLEAAKAEKLFGGHAAPWTGGVTSSAFGAMWITRAKLLRTADNAAQLLDGRMCVADYRSFVGFVISLNALRQRERYDTSGLHSPLHDSAELGRGPTTLVRCSGKGRHNFRRRWTAISKRILDSPGVSVLVACGLHDPAPALTPLLRWEVSLDASGDDAPSPGLGTFLYGKWQHVPTSSDPRLGCLSIAHLEALAAGLGLLLAFAVLRGVGALDLVTDALASYLAYKSDAHSLTLVAIHECVLSTPEYRELSGRGSLRVVHRWGELNVGGDYASRLKTAELTELCATLRLDERRLELSPRQLEWLDCATSAAYATLRTADPSQEGGDAQFYAPRSSPRVQLARPTAPPAATAPFRSNKPIPAWPLPKKEAPGARPETAVRPRSPDPNPPGRAGTDAHDPPPAAKQLRRCGVCGQLGHNRRTCSVKPPRRCSVCSQPGHNARTCARRQTRLKAEQHSDDARPGAPPAAPTPPAPSSSTPKANEAIVYTLGMRVHTPPEARPPDDDIARIRALQTATAVTASTECRLLRRLVRPRSR